MKRRRDDDQNREPLSLDPELKKTLAEVGPQHYGRATARHFAKGGKFNNPKRKQRYAIT